MRTFIFVLIQGGAARYAGGGVNMSQGEGFRGGYRGGGGRGEGRGRGGYRGEGGFRGGGRGGGYRGYQGGGGRGRGYEGGGRGSGRGGGGGEEKSGSELDWSPPGCAEVMDPITRAAVTAYCNK